MRQWGIPASRGPNLRLRFRMVENLATRKKKFSPFIRSRWVKNCGQGHVLWVVPMRAHRSTHAIVVHLVVPRLVGCASGHGYTGGKDFPPIFSSSTERRELYFTAKGMALWHSQCIQMLRVLAVQATVA